MRLESDHDMYTMYVYMKKKIAEISFHKQLSITR